MSNENVNFNNCLSSMAYVLKLLVISSIKLNYFINGLEMVKYFFQVVGTCIKAMHPGPSYLRFEDGVV